MTPRGRFEAAVRGRSPDRIPVVLPYFHLYLDKVAGELTDLSWAHRMYGTPEEKAEIYRLSHTWFGLDWLPIGGIGSSILSLGKKLEKRGGKLYLVDTASGAESVLPPEKPAEEPVTERLVTGADDDLDAKLPPVLTPEEIIESKVLEPARILAEEYGSSVMITGGVSMPGNQNYFYLGIYDMMTALKFEPELVHRLVGHSRRMILNLLPAMKEAGIGCVWLEDNFVAGDLISRGDYETFFFEANAEIIEAAKREGLLTVYYLTGDVMSRIPHILELNPDCLAFEESRKTFAVDPAEVRRAVGDEMCLFGNIDVYAVIERGDETMWEEAIRHQLKAARPEGRFVLSAGSPVTHDTPKEKVRDFVRFAKTVAR